MRIKRFIELASSCFAIGLLPVFLMGCNTSVSDPFSSPTFPVGQKVFVPPDPINKVSLSLNSETLTTRATVLKLSRINEMASSRSGLSTVGSEAGVELKSLTVIGKDGVRIEMTADRIKKINDSPACAAIANELRDLLALNQGMTLICDEEFTKAFRLAKSAIITTKDGQDSEFTSWGSQWLDLSGYRVVFQAMSL